MKVTGTGGGIRQVRFGGIDEQRQYERWLETFPPETLRQIAGLARVAHGESRRCEGEPRTIRGMMRRAHIRAAIKLGRKNPWVGRFNRLIVELNKQRLRAVRAGDAEALRQAQEPLTDLGHAVMAVLGRAMGCPHMAHAVQSPTSPPAACPGAGLLQIPLPELPHAPPPDTAQNATIPPK